jgi:hypothetical protein
MEEEFIHLRKSWLQRAAAFLIDHEETDICKQLSLKG